MKKIIITLTALLAVSLTAKAEDFTGFVESDKILGNISAPVSFIEYASMTCGHCASFDKEVVSKLKKEYVETGKVAYTLRDFPLDELAFAVSKVNHCAPEGMYFKFAATFFETQRKWIYAEDKLEAVTSIAKMGGMTSADIQKCILDDKTHKLVEANYNSGLEVGVNSTPTFLINGRVYRGNLGYEKVKSIIEAELAN